MRPIKFRAYSKATDNIREVISLDFEEHWALLEDGDQEDFEDIDLMQFTGLKDKNGREIYEGDLFEHEFGYLVLDDTPHDEMGTECGVVVFEDGRFGVRTPGWGTRSLRDLLSRNGHLDDMPDNDLFTMIIAGNKFENPDLLEASK